MQYKSIKSASEAPFPLELVKHDSSINAVVIGDLRIESDYGLKVLLAQPYEEVKRNRVTATVDGFGARVLYFENDYCEERRDAINKFEKAGATVVSADTKVLIDEKGKIGRDLETGVDSPESDDLLF